MITFDYNPANSSTDALAGFMTDDPSLYAKIKDYCQTVGTSPTLIANNNTTSAPRIKTHVMHWAWTQLQDIQPSTTLNISVDTRTFSTDNLESPAIIESYDDLRKNPGFTGNTTPIKIVWIRKGMGWFTKIHERHPNEIIPAFGTLLTENKTHRIAVYRQDTGRIVIYTNQMTPMLYYKIIGLLPAFFPDAYNCLLDNANTKAILEALFETNAEKLLPYITASFKDMYEVQRTSRINQFLGLAKDMLGSPEKELEKALERTRDDLQSYINNIRALIERERDLTWQITGLHLEPPGTAVDDLKAFLTKNKNITFSSDMGSSYFILKITTPIMNYVTKDVEGYFKHPDRETYLNHPDWFAKAMKAIFLEEKYRVITTSRIQVDWRGKISGKPNSDGLYGNTHIATADCFASTKNVCQQALAKGDMISVISALTSACATLVFTDSAIIRRFRAEMKTTYHDKPIIQCVETGEMISMADLKKIIEE